MKQQAGEGAGSLREQNGRKSREFGAIPWPNRFNGVRVAKIRHERPGRVETKDTSCAARVSHSMTPFRVASGRLVT